MKKPIFILVALLFFIFSNGFIAICAGKPAAVDAFDAPQVESGSATMRKLPFKTAVIIYQYKGGQKGTETISIDAVNNRINQEGEITIQGPSGQNMSKKIRKLYDGKNFYEFVYKENMAIQSPRKRDAVDLLFNESAILENYQYAGESTVLGKKLKVYKSAMELSGLWNGIELKKKVINNPFGEKFNYVKTATRMKTDVPIPESTFQVPSGVTILTEEQAIKKMQGMFQSLANKPKRSCPLARP